MREAGGEDVELDDEEEDQALALGFLGGAEDSEVEAGPGAYTEDDLPGEFGEDLGQDEDFPGIGSRGPFANFVEGSLGDEFGHDSVYLSASVLVYREGRKLTG